MESACMEEGLRDWWKFKHGHWKSVLWVKTWRRWVSEKGMWFLKEQHSRHQDTPRTNALRDQCGGAEWARRLGRVGMNKVRECERVGIWQNVFIIGNPLQSLEEKTDITCSTFKMFAFYAFLWINFQRHSRETS